MSNLEPIVNQNPPTEQELTFHVCNHAAKLIPTYRQLAVSWEDWNVNDLESADDEFEFINRAAPGAFVLIDTGDYIIPWCCDYRNPNRPDPHPDHETYDATYQKLLVPRLTWDACKAVVMEADRQWREEKMRCPLAEPPAGVGGGLGYGPPVVTAPDAPINAYDEYRAVLWVIHHCDLPDKDKNALWDATDAALDCFTADGKAEALAVVAMTLAMRVRACGATGGGRDA